MEEWKLKSRLSHGGMVAGFVLIELSPASHPAIYGSNFPGAGQAVKRL
jgi:hypothetical protein